MRWDWRAVDRRWTSDQTSPYRTFSASGHIRGWFRLELNGPSGPAVLALQIHLVFATRQNLGLNDDPAPAAKCQAQTDEYYSL